MCADKWKVFFSLPKPRYGKRTCRAAQKWLNKRDVNLDDLTEEQQVVILRFTKGRLIFYCTAPIIITFFLVTVLFGTSSFKFAETEIKEVKCPYGYFVAADGQEVFAKLADRQIEFTETRLSACFIIGVVFGSIMVTALGGLGYIIGQMLLIKEFDKVFGAFLAEYSGAE